MAFQVHGQNITGNMVPTTLARLEDYFEDLILWKQKGGRNWPNDYQNSLGQRHPNAYSNFFSKVKFHLLSESDLVALKKGEKDWLQKRQKYLSSVNLKPFDNYMDFLSAFF